MRAITRVETDITRQSVRREFPDRRSAHRGSPNRLPAISGHDERRAISVRRAVTTPLEMPNPLVQRQQSPLLHQARPPSRRYPCTAQVEAPAVQRRRLHHESRPSVGAGSWQPHRHQSSSDQLRIRSRHRAPWSPARRQRLPEKPPPRPRQALAPPTPAWPQSNGRQRFSDR